MRTLFSSHAESQKEGGVALLFAILLTSTLLLIAMGISKISYKEGIFALEARDSGRAFTAADTGIECGLYLDNNDVFTTNSDTFYCHGSQVIVSGSGTSFQFSLNISPTSCAQVYVDKNYAGTSTRIESYGYNIKQQQPTSPATCLTSAVTTNIVTRALRVTYVNPVVGP
jgi:hypothetical protein